MKDRRERETEKQTSRHTSTIEDRYNELEWNWVRQTERKYIDKIERERAPGEIYIIYRVQASRRSSEEEERSVTNMRPFER